MNTHVEPSHRNDEPAVELTTEEARAGATPHMTRYILGWGLALVLIAFLVVLLANNWG